MIDYSMRNLSILVDDLGLIWDIIDLASSRLCNFVCFILWWWLSLLLLIVLLSWMIILLLLPLVIVVVVVSFLSDRIPLLLLLVSDIKP